MSFCNPDKKILTYLEGDVIGHAKLAGLVMVNPDWLHAMESPNLVHSMGKNRPASGGNITKSNRTQQLVEQLGLMENRLLTKYPQVMSRLIDVITRYERAFTDGDVSVGKTDVLKMKIVLDEGVTPVRAPVRKIKPAHSGKSMSKISFF